MKRDATLDSSVTNLACFQPTSILYSPKFLESILLMARKALVHYVFML